MKPSRAIFAALALPLALSLAACGGGSGSNTISNITGTQGQIRFINGAPNQGAFDVYYTSTGSSASTIPLVTNLAYGQITDFSGQSTTAVQITLRPGNSTSSTAGVGGCTVPQLGNNANYSVVFVNTGSAVPVGCVVFQDALYTSPGQYRVHHASPIALNAGNGTLSFGLTNGTTVTSFTVAGSAVFPGIGNTTFAQVAIAGPATAATPVGIAVGASGQPGTTQVALAQINANAFVAPGGIAGQNPPDTANTLPGIGTAQNNASIFAIDAPTGGIKLIGSFDTK